MNLKSYLFGLTLVIFLLTPGVGRVSAQDKSLETAFDTMQYADDGTSVSGLSVIAIKNGEVAYSYSGGRRYIDNENSENDLLFTEDTKLRIASVSKSFTAAAIMQLVDQDKIDLDTDVSEYLNSPFEIRIIRISPSPAGSFSAIQAHSTTQTTTAMSVHRRSASKNISEKTEFSIITAINFSKIMHPESFITTAI